MSIASTHIPLTLPGGEKAYVSETDGDKTTIMSPLAAPPGATVKASIDGVACEFQLKVRNCKKSGDLFAIDGRVRNATRELRAALTKKSSKED